jgi:hypothetical protein
MTVISIVIRKNTSMQQRARDSGRSRRNDSNFNSDTKEFSSEAVVLEGLRVVFLGELC